MPYNLSDFIRKTSCLLVESSSIGKNSAMPINWKSLESPAEIVSKIVMAVAVTLGGAWAWYTFNGELKRENAQAQLEKFNRELENSRYHALEVDLEAKSMPSFGNDYSIQVKVSILNKGYVAASIPLVEKSLRVTPVTVPNFPFQPQLATESAVNPKPLVTDSEGHLASVDELRVPVGTSNRLLYLAQVDAPGRYLVEFSVPSSEIGPRVSKDYELSEAVIVDVPPIEAINRPNGPPSRDRRKIGD